MNPAENREPRLPFPTQKIKVKGGEIEEYIIPDEKKGEVLEQLYPFKPVPSLEEKQYDLHEGKNFVVKEFRVTRENGMNFLVSPYYANSGGSVIDWMPAD